VFFIFGWVKESKEVGRALDCYCYRCQRIRAWEHWRETEWVSFFGIKTIPFLWKNFVPCTTCRDPVRLGAAQARQVEDKKEFPSLAAFLEEHQLSQKSELQRNFLQSQRAQQESRQ
jgi:hypothetical protein